MRPPKLLILLALTVFPAFFSRLGMALDKPTVRFGAIVPLSGDMALHGVEIQRSMLMALEAEARPGNHYDYKIVFEDNGLALARSVSAAQKLISIDKVETVLTLWPPSAGAVLPFTERAQVLHYTIAWDPELARKNKFLLSHQCMVDEIARSTLRLLRREGKMRVAFLHMEEAGFNLGA